MLEPTSSSLPPEELSGIRALATVVAGRVVHMTDE